MTEGLMLICYNTVTRTEDLKLVCFCPFTSAAHHIHHLAKTHLLISGYVKLISDTL